MAKKWSSNKTCPQKNPCFVANAVTLLKIGGTAALQDRYSAFGYVLWDPKRLFGTTVPLSK